MLTRYFQLDRLQSNVRTEVAAGVTTFLTMAYIVVVNPSILSLTGMPIAAVAAATCLIAGLASLMMGLYANVPLALAPGMGLNAYFTFTVVKSMGVPWQVGLGCIFLSGVFFLVLTLIGVRKVIVDAIPRPLLSAVAAGVGLFIAFIGLKDAGIVIADAGTTVTLGDLTQPAAYITLLGLVLIAALQHFKVPAAILFGVLGTAVAEMALGLGGAHMGPYNPLAITQTAFKLDLHGALTIGGGAGLTMLEIVFVFLFVDLFDSVGTLVAVASKAGLVDADGKIPSINRVLIVDSCASMAGALAGTSTVEGYIESAAGVAAGGRSGLTAVVVGVLFLLTFFLAPFVQAIPTAAAAPALILVGSLMVSSLSEIDWTDPTVAIPAFLTAAVMPLTFSIANGISLGLISYALLRLVTGKATRKDWLLFLLAALLVVRFIYVAKSRGH